MTNDNQAEVEDIQRVVASHVATHPVGYNLPLIGGFRYRFLDGSVRTSDDIDYHWAGDLESKQEELMNSFRRELLSDIFRRFGYSGSAEKRTGPDANLPIVRVVDLFFWKDGVPYSRIEIPVEVTRICCVDPVKAHPAKGTIYATASDGDMIESKVIAIFGRRYLKHRDLVDLFLFQDHFPSDSAQRLKSKLHTSQIADDDIKKRMRDLQERSDYHARSIQEVIDTQLDATAAVQLSDSGGGEKVLDEAMQILDRYIDLETANDGD